MKDKLDKDVEQNATNIITRRQKTSEHKYGEDEDGLGANLYR
jgi:hypothetical protein